MRIFHVLKPMIRQGHFSNILSGSFWQMISAGLFPSATPTPPKLMISVLSLKIALAYLIIGKGSESELPCREQFTYI